ncbi:MAG: formylglycine-generating enzyme family protein [Desulfobacterales bacterium]|jgi:formylglycine-generating enzyme required for sulfatase activity|nr:formylglycine-generating enzyme family protein [Desulfobacteraceae bacterium]MBT7698553.1 formylglycine-generating enzyme family protein [Desulfobacterales bacterium]
MRYIIITCFSVILLSLFSDLKAVAYKTSIESEEVIREKGNSDLDQSYVINKDGIRSKSIKNSIGMEFVYINPGTFIMGSPPGEYGRFPNEVQHKVTITKGFYIQTTEVTQRQWKSVMGSNPSYFINCGDDCPVEQVSWEDVQEFIKKLNHMEGENRYRLPTEAEWEYSCRAGSTTVIYSGERSIIGRNNDPPLDQIAWYGGNSCVNYSGGYDCTNWPGRQYSCPNCGTNKVAQKEPNAWGLYDMMGNVWEWCQDWEGDYPEGSVTDPQGPADGLFRTERGGCWLYIARYCRSAQRFEDTPDIRDNTIGFRLLSTGKPDIIFARVDQ